MATKKTLSYSIENTGNNITKEFQYSDYSKSDDKQENILLYKSIMRGSESLESFNKLYKYDDNISEIIGNSKNKHSWKIKQYKNNLFQKQYKEDYDRIKFNINYDIIENMNKNNHRFIKDKLE